MVISGIYILDRRGKVLISRDYRGNVPFHIVDRFVSLLGEAETTQRLAPVLYFEGYHYLYVLHSNIYVLAISRTNTNAATVFQFLYKFIQVLKDQFSGLEEGSVRDNFVVIYELLDEMMDFGYPQFTDSRVLREYLTQKSRKLEMPNTTTMTNPISWRSEGIKYRKNQVFLDVVETMNFLIGPSNQVLNSEVQGSVRLRCELDGMPELELGLNDRMVLENLDSDTDLIDVKFHQCVRLSQLKNERVISFVPPDGEFELLSYCFAIQSPPLLEIDCTANFYSGTRIEMVVKVKARLDHRLVANRIQIDIPVMEDAVDPEFKTAMGSATYVPDKDIVAWKIKQLPAGKESSLQMQYHLPSVRIEEHVKRPISIHFEIPGFTVSGMQIRQFKIVDPPGSNARPWVRYTTQTGDYHVKMSDPIVKFDTTF